MWQSTSLVSSRHAPCSIHHMVWPILPNTNLAWPVFICKTPVLCFKAMTNSPALLTNNTAKRQRGQHCPDKLTRELPEQNRGSLCHLCLGMPYGSAGRHVCRHRTISTRQRRIITPLLDFIDRRNLSVQWDGIIYGRESVSRTYRCGALGFRIHIVPMFVLDPSCLAVRSTTTNTKAMSNHPPLPEKQVITLVNNKTTSNGIQTIAAL